MILKRLYRASTVNIRFNKIIEDSTGEQKHNRRGIQGKLKVSKKCN